MTKPKLLALIALMSSFSAFATMDAEQQERQVELLPAVDAEAYQREVVYEQFNLPVEVRAKRETNILAEKIKNQISVVYQNALEESGSPELALTAVRAKVEVDLELVAPELREDIREISMRALDSVQLGSASTEISAPSIEADMQVISALRSDYLQSGFLLLNAPESDAKAKKPSDITKADVTEYKNKKDLISSLVSTETSVMGGYMSSNAGISSQKTTSFGGSVSYRVRVKFLGADLNAGPSISFSRNYNTSVSVSGDGLRPMMTRDGNFDFYVRDAAGKIVNKNGKPEKRYLSFGCNADLSFGTVYNGSGGFSIAGVGADAYVSRSYSNDVSLSSRRVAVPEYIEGKTVTLSVLAQLCNTDFMNAKLMNNMTLKDSLNVMMRDVVSSLVFSHPKTKCVTDQHCAGWFKKDVQPVAGRMAVARCLEETREHFMACYARGVNGAKCPVYKDKKLLSDGVGEYSCDKGLRCQQVKEYGWFQNYKLFQYAEGRCTK